MSATPSPIVAPPPRLAMPPRPAKPLSAMALLKTAATNTLAICDEQVFDELVVVRRYGLAALAFVSDPAGIKRVLIDAFDDYPRVPAVSRLYKAEIGTGTLATDGEIWWRHRRVAAPTLDRRAIAPDVPGLIASAEALAAAVGDGHAGGPTNVEARVAEMWILLLNQMVTGGDARGMPILAWLARVPRKPRLLDLLPMPAWLVDRVSPARQSDERVALREDLLAMVSERTGGDYAGPRDLLWRIAHGIDRETGQPLSLPEMRDEASSLIAAGDATVRALTWIWYLLALHPEVERRLHTELDDILGEGPLQAEHLRKLVYTRQVLDEVVRLYPPVPIVPRMARRSDVIGGKRIPRGAVVMVMPWVVHRHRRLWTDPDAFDPGRFSAERSRDRPRFAYIPFSVGPRTCSGSSFAITQMLIICVSLARRYRFRLASDAPVVPFGGITLQPRGGLWMTIERR